MTHGPDFVIAGAARCGTTALCAYLTQHPSVFMPALKEPGFFSTDLRGGLATEGQYTALFAGAPAGALTGEASTRYLYSRIAIGHLVRHNPAVRVIVMLRNPIDAAQSLHGYAYRYGHDSQVDFEAAWRAQAARRAAQARLDAGAPEPLREFDFSARYRYAEQVRRVLCHLPARQCHFILYEEFFADPPAQFAAVLRFLDLDPLAPASFPVVNAHRAVRSARLEHLMRQPPQLLRRLYAPLRGLLEATGLRPGKWLARVNWDARRRQPLRPAFRLELERHFAPDVAELERLLGRCLWSEWRQDGAAA